MKLAIAAALGLMLLVGLALGALGGGGSILTLPIFVYVASFSTTQAVAMSKVVVGGTSLLAAALHYWRGNFHLKAAGLFAAAGVVASYFGSWMTGAVPPRILMLSFAGVMFAAGLAMLRRRGENTTPRQCRVVRCLLIGAAAGLLTGFLGVGGGFLIVPALVLFAGVDTKRAVGASLAVIALNAAAGLVGQAQREPIEWGLSLGFLGLAILGMLGGLVLAEKVPERRLSQAFAWMIVLLALVIAAINLPGIAIRSG